MVEKEEKGKITSRIIPDFSLISSDGRLISPSMYRNKQNLVLVFVHFYQCSSCYPILYDLKKLYTIIHELNTEVLLIVSGDEKTVKDLQHLWMLPFPLLSDLDNQVTKQYLGVNIEHRPAVLIIDRYGHVCKFFIGMNNMELKLQNILKWLEFIEGRCPECDVMDQPVGDEILDNLPFS